MEGACMCVCVGGEMTLACTDTQTAMNNYHSTQSHGIYVCLSEVLVLL